MRERKTSGRWRREGVGLKPGLRVQPRTADLLQRGTSSLAEKSKRSSGETAALQLGLAVGPGEPPVITSAFSVR